MVTNGATLLYDLCSTVRTGLFLFASAILAVSFPSKIHSPLASLPFPADVDTVSASQDVFNSVAVLVTTPPAGLLHVLRLLASVNLAFILLSNLSFVEVLFVAADATDDDELATFVEAEPVAAA